MFAIACVEIPGDGPGLAKQRRESTLSPGEHVPAAPEVEVVGAREKRIRRNSAEFGGLVKCSHPLIVFKDEERSGADRMMTPRLRDALSRLAELVARRWPDVRLRVTEAWDEDGEHGANSLHEEGRAADITTSDLDGKKLGDLARLAVEANLDWVYFEDSSHVHVSVRR